MAPTKRTKPQILGEEGVRFPDAETGPFELTVKWGVVQGAAAVVGLSVDQLDPDAPAEITAQTIRRLAFRQLAEQARRRALQARSFHVATAGEDEEARRRAEERLGQVPRRPSKRPKARSNDFYEGVAILYSAQLREGNPTPTKAVKDAYGVPSATAANWVRRARELGFLEPTEPGKAGGAR
jgi:hypothetical protein